MATGLFMHLTFLLLPCVVTATKFVRGLDGKVFLIEVEENKTRETTKNGKKKERRLLFSRLHFFSCKLQQRRMV